MVEIVDLVNVLVSVDLENGFGFIVEVVVDIILFVIKVGFVGGLIEDIIY